MTSPSRPVRLVTVPPCDWPIYVIEDAETGIRLCSFMIPEQRAEYLKITGWVVVP